MEEEGVVVVVGKAYSLEPSTGCSTTRVGLLSTLSKGTCPRLPGQDDGELTKLMPAIPPFFGRGRGTVEKDEVGRMSSNRMRRIVETNDIFEGGMFLQLEGIRFLGYW